MPFFYCYNLLSFNFLAFVSSQKPTTVLNYSYMKMILSFVIAILLLAGGTIYYLSSQNKSIETESEVKIDTSENKEDSSNLPETNFEPEEKPNEVEKDNSDKGSKNNQDSEVIGKSVNGNDIVAYHFGSGDEEVMFIGGIHGGYSWNTSLLSFEVIKWLKANPSLIPNNLSVTVIPVLNPDGLKKVTGKTGEFSVGDVDNTEAVWISGRFNGSNVDLNRNFDCEWQAKGTWQSREVSGGTTPFSEPEALAIKNYVTKNNPKAIVTWYSASGEVFASNCKNGILPETTALTNLYAKAASYPARENYNYYEITGDMVNWFAKQNIPAISVLLSKHGQTDLSKNKAGIEAVLQHYGN